MKIKLLLLVALFTSAIAAAQNAASCGAGCSYFPVSVKRGSGCGNANKDMSFTVRNDWGRTATSFCALT